MLKTVTTTEYDRDRTPRRPIFSAVPRYARGAHSGRPFCIWKNEKEVILSLKEQKSPLLRRQRRINIGEKLFTAFLAASLAGALSVPVFAADTLWTKASAIMQDVYSQIITISTIAAVVCASVALLLMNFSRSDRTVQESRSWLKRIIVSWAILNGLGFIMAYITPFFADGKYTP